MDAFKTIIAEIQAMRAELDDLEARMARNDILRRNIPLDDDYAQVHETDWLEHGRFK